ncbi:MAG: glycosyltransferase family 2 protein [Acidimicrobiia bacterium]|nr:glycosyltransferase family 2 protein [Acidimicrobiia bacterium]
MPRLCLYIPCYNAARFLAATVGRIPWTELPEGFDYLVLFVDNASQDATGEQVKAAQAALEAGGVSTHFIRHPQNRGYGGSVKSAMDYCVQNGFAIMAVVHADGQYAPELLPRMIGELQRRPESALHFGSRLTGAPLKGGMPLYKFIGNIVLSGVQNLFLATRLSEFHSGYRLYHVPYLARLPYQRCSDGFVFDNQIIFQIHCAGFGISESPIPTFYGEEKSHVPRIGTPLAILRELAVCVLHRWGLRRSRLYDVEVAP